MSLQVAKFQFAFFGINTYIVYDESTGDAIIVDPGMHSSEEIDAINKFIERKKLHINLIVATHMHIDHVVGIQHMDKNIPVAGNRKDAVLGKSIKMQAALFSVGSDFENVEIDKPLVDGDIIKVGTGELKVIEAPGHSQGSIMLYDEKDGFVIVGDVLFENSIGRTDLPGGDYNQLIDSINAKLMSLPDDTRVFPGHGPETTIGNEKRYNPFLSPR